MKRKIVTIVLVGVAMAGVMSACGSSTQTATAAKAPAGSPSTSSIASATAQGGMPDGCKIVTPSLVKQTLGLDVKDGKPVGYASDAEHSACSFKLVSTYVGFVLVQVTSKLDAKFDKNKQGLPPMNGVGDSGYILAPSDGQGGFVFVKNGIGVTVKIWADPHYTIDQEKALAQAIAAEM